MADMLLQRGANVNAQDHQGYTPLTTACSTDDAGEDMVKLLLEHKADTEFQTKIGELDNLTALMCAVRGGMEDIARLLLEAGANPNLPS
jgi:ankyrin repeat protein